MKLHIPDWKSAWFDYRISDRFFQELAKLEHNTAMSLENTAQWMAQVMIEAGQLAQAMIRLEEPGSSPAQVRQAAEKALRLSALALHLTTGLDQAQRSPDGPDALPYAAYLQPQWAAGRPEREATSYPEETGRGPARPEPAAPGAPPRPFPLRPFLTPQTLAGTADAPTKPPGEKKAASPGDANPPAPANGAPSDPFDVPLLGGLIEIDGRNGQGEGSALRQTILSLSSRGLSRAEIEVITGQPRHIIEAVLAEG